MPIGRRLERLVHRSQAEYARSVHPQAVQGVSLEAAQALVAHDWPGNIRELRNAIERAMFRAEAKAQKAHPGCIFQEALSAQPAEQKPSHTPELGGMSLEEAEKTMLLNALQRAGWNQTRTAQLLSITRDTLRYRMKTFNLRSAMASQPE